MTNHLDSKYCAPYTQGAIDNLIKIFLTYKLSSMNLQILVKSHFLVSKASSVGHVWKCLLILSNLRVNLIYNRITSPHTKSCKVHKQAKISSGKFSTIVVIIGNGESPVLYLSPTYQLSTRGLSITLFYMQLYRIYTEVENRECSQVYSRNPPPLTAFMLLHFGVLSMKTVFYSRASRWPEVF